ncbi:MAG: T9SS type A sorting domain-containing protein, partial [Bacteroidales bacterium]|nr:T9SS type A sorting domain-containing protein [Bacteroidales bacterium]
QAGPVDGLYSMTGQYNYNLSRTLSWYQSAGTSRDKIILGLPYYGRVWGTQGPHPPSNITIHGQALTYYQVRSNYSGNYSNENKFWEQNSFSPYFSYQTTGWNQCFINDVNSLAKRYDMVNQRGLAGIGIWALGYDRGYTDLWELIQNKFTAGSSCPCNDTIYDSGGPTFDYYNNENYSITIAPKNSINLTLTFLSFELEQGYDLLHIFDGPDTQAPLIGTFTGHDGPGVIHASGNALTLEVISDQATTRAGWKAMYACSPFQIDISENEKVKTFVKIFPNPVNEDSRIQFHLKQPANIQIIIIDPFGNRKGIITDGNKQLGLHSIHLNPADYGIKTSGVYFLQIYSNGVPTVAKKWLYLPSN